MLPENLDALIVLHVSCTCDDHNVCVGKDSSEVIELAWIVLDTKTLTEKHRDSILIRPQNTPITEACSNLTGLTWEHVRSAGIFREGIHRFDSFVQEHLIDKGLDFSFAVLDSWDIRVQIPREARDKHVALPLYLQHSRTYELRAEYTKWQVHHPEALVFGPSSLTNICAALDVDTHPNSQHNTYHQMQTLPKRASEMCSILAQVVRQIIRKSVPAEQHQDIFSRPLDGRADVRAFLEERSKIIHMRNLPHDTTQSELESWFTQHGGRPTAFWTFRTPDQQKPTGSGFAVFSSHEEAAESLGMNGKALGERAIEVSPSSSRVLERASAFEILTPFPPSKNRPRPGDWNCPSCHFSNFQRRTACFRCQFPAVPPTTNGSENVNVYVGYGAHSTPGMHTSNAPMAATHSLVMRPPPPGGSVPFRAGDWKCGSDGCGYHNFAKNIACLRCGAGKATAALVSENQGNPMLPPLNTSGVAHRDPVQSPFSPTYSSHNGSHPQANQVYPTISPIGSRPTGNSTPYSPMAPSYPGSSGAFPSNGDYGRTFSSLAENGNDDNEWLCRCGFANSRLRTACLRCNSQNNQQPGELGIAFGQVNDFLSNGFRNISINEMGTNGSNGFRRSSPQTNGNGQVHKLQQRSFEQTTGENRDIA